MPGPGPRGPRGPKPRVENPGKLMGRLLKYVGKNYGIHHNPFAGFVRSVLSSLTFQGLI